MPQQVVPIWQPSAETIQQSNVKKYMNWLLENRALRFKDYDELWEWSVREIADFWESLWEYFEIIAHTPYNEVVSSHKMPDTVWFSGATLNYAEHIFRNKTTLSPAIIFKSEDSEPLEISWQELENKVASLACWFRQQGIQKGDTIAAYLPNIPEATIALLATISVGAIWSSCSPDFGTASVIERFQQIEPKILLGINGYRYNGKVFDNTNTVAQIAEKLPTIQHIVTINYLENSTVWNVAKPTKDWEIIMQQSVSEVLFEAVPFAHPLWVLYSSGTTGKPKAITHSHGGILLEHLKYLSFHNDLKTGERFFWFSTTGWMMWNFVQATLLLGGTIVMYDGNPAYPNQNSLWQLANDLKINHFGTSASFILACKKANLEPRNQFDLRSLRSISSTGSPLPPEGFDWIYENVKSDIWFCSMSGGTDVCTAFVGGIPTENVYQGEIQRPCLGASVLAFDDHAKPIVGEVGEMVITQPMPSMPIYFWNDPSKEQYIASYFEMYPCIWRHGDWLTITNRKTLVISGRSDATLNRNGIRIGTAEVYRVIEQIPDIVDSLIVNIEQLNGEHYMPLFVHLKQGICLDEHITQKIKMALKTAYSPRHVPDKIISVAEIPYTLSGKKMETPVKKILMGISPEKAANIGAMRNPESLQFFIEFGKTMKDNGL